MPPPASELFTVDATANFVEGAEYEQEDIPASAKDRVLAATLHYCEQRAQKRGAAGYFYQQHTNGHEIVGFYTSAETMAAGKAMSAALWRRAGPQPWGRWCSTASLSSRFEPQRHVVPLVVYS